MYKWMLGTKVSLAGKLKGRQRLGRTANSDVSEVHPFRLAESLCHLLLFPLAGGSVVCLFCDVHSGDNEGVAMEKRNQRDAGCSVGGGRGDGVG